MIKFFKFSDIEPKFSPRGTATHVMVDNLTGAQMSGGIAQFKDTEIAFEFWYEECMFCLSIEESFSVEVDGREHFMSPGDMIWYREGTKAIWRAKGKAVLIFAITPPTWVDTRPERIPVPARLEPSFSS